MLKNYIAKNNTKHFLSKKFNIGTAERLPTPTFFS